jgi:hypothetical protein
MRKTVISFALAPLFSSSLGAAADENPSDRIGSTSVSARTEAFRQGLRELGVEGKNIVIEWRRHEGKVDRLPALATELVRLKVDVIVVTGVGDLRSAKRPPPEFPLSWLWKWFPRQFGGRPQMLAGCQMFQGHGHRHEQQ